MTKAERLAEILSLRVEAGKADADLIKCWHRGHHDLALLESAIELGNKLKEAEKWYARLHGRLEPDKATNGQHHAAHNQQEE